LKKVFALDLGAGELRWREIDAWPGPARMLAVAATYDASFWVIGGADLTVSKSGQVERRYLKDAYRYDAGKGWKRIADLPRAVVAAPSPAPSTESGLLILGGDEGSQVNVASDKHVGFSKRMLRYDAMADKWIDAGEMPAAHVTTPLVQWKKMWVIPNGEVRPGVRSPEVWTFRLK
jgi:N-acetylneuraminate epimerase